MNLPQIHEPAVHEPATLPTSNDGGLSVLGVGNDADAVAMWLRARGARSENTARTYARCSDRLLQWCQEREMTLAEMSVADAQAHLDTLRNPNSRWLIPRDEKGKLLVPLYKSQTLKQPMTDKGVAFARTVLGQLFHYLLTAGYVRRNVFFLTEIPPTIEDDLADKVLSQSARKYLWDWLSAQQADEQQKKPLEPARDRWICALLYYTGIRTQEAIAGSMADFVRDSEGWQLRVTGKGSKVRRVTVTEALARELLRFREAMGVRGWPPPTDTMPLIPHTRNTKGPRLPVSDRMLRKIVSTLCKAAARDCDDLHIAAELERTSPHWFRHTSATHRQESGARLETTQQELGHANPKTTLRYAKIAARARREDAERFASAAAAATYRQEKEKEE